MPGLGTMVVKLCIVFVYLTSTHCSLWLLSTVFIVFIVDFQTLFPGSQVMTGDFTVVSLCQRSDNDMSGWSEQVEVERESLIELYSETAKELCTVLRNSGFWADFIDPCSGKPVSANFHDFLD